MTDRRFHVHPEDSTATHLLLREDEAHHARKVLRLRPGSSVVCFDGAGRGWRATIEVFDRAGARLAIDAALPPEPAPPVLVTLAQGLVKGDRMDFIIQKATELGVSRILPLTCDRGDVRLDDARAGKRAERWRRITIEAAKQCERLRVPEVLSPMTVAEAIATAGAPSVALTERGGDPAFDALDRLFGSGDLARLALFVGPEGGWSERERERFSVSDVRQLSLGSHILRAETAAVAALALTLLRS